MERVAVQDSNKHQYIQLLIDWCQTELVKRNWKLLFLDLTLREWLNGFNEVQLRRRPAYSQTAIDIKDWRTIEWSGCGCSRLK